MSQEKLKWKSGMNGSAFMGDEEAKHLGRRSSFHASGRFGQYVVEPTWRDGQVKYVVSVKPPHSSGWSVPVEGNETPVGKPYSSPETGRRAAQQYEARMIALRGHMTKTTRDRMASGYCLWTVKGDWCTRKSAPGGICCKQHAPLAAKLTPAGLIANGLPLDWAERQD